MQKWIAKIKDALFKTRNVMPWHDSTARNESIEINEEYYEELLERLIKADVGFDLSQNIVSNLKSQIKSSKINNTEFQNIIRAIIKTTVGTGLPCPYNTQTAPNNPTVFLIVGVNGSGKTTSIGKLAKKYKDSGCKVLIVAGDTFRAAAGEQLEIWAKRVDVDIFSSEEIKKPDAVAYSSLEKAKKENYDLVLIDTAGRLHSQTNLMDELKKINSVIVKAIPTEGEARQRRHELPQPYEKLIVLDATIGQNAIVQAELFSKAINLTGIILAKLDSSAKGGVVLNIMHKLSLPVKFIGTGENIDDIAEFNFDEYLEGLLL